VTNSSSPTSRLHVPLGNTRETLAAIKSARTSVNPDRFRRHLGPDVEIYPQSMDYVYFEQFTTARRDHLMRIGSAVLAIGVVVFCFMNGATVGDLRRHRLTQCTSLAIDCEGARADDNTSHHRLGIHLNVCLQQ